METSPNPCENWPWGSEITGVRSFFLYNFAERVLELLTAIVAITWRIPAWHKAGTKKSKTKGQGRCPDASG